MNLDDLLKEMKEKMQKKDLSDEYLEKNGNTTRTEIGIGEYSYGITTIPCEWVYDFLSDYKRVLKENEELKQDRNNNYQMIALAQNEALGYMQGYEDGKKLKRSAIANIVENQQYYIIKKQIEKYETYIEQLRKKLGQKDKIIDLMAETINNYDIDEDVCKQMGQKANCNEYEDAKECKECIKQYFINKAKEIR